MAKTLTLTFDGKEYTLEFTRDTVRNMERAGFVADDLLAKPLTLFPQLFSYAFQAHHRYARPGEIDKIFASLNSKPELLTRLIEMYREPYQELMDDPEEPEGNVTWTANF